MNRTERSVLFLSIIIILILNLIALYPVLFSGWYFDDYINSYIKGTIGIEGLDFVQFIKTRLSYWLLDGRFFPLSSLYYIIYWLFSYPVNLLKIVYVLGTIFASISYYFFLRKLSNSFWFALLPITFLPIIFQYRSYHDPLTSYHLLMQVTFILLISSMLLFVYYFMDAKKSYRLLGASVLLYLTFLLTYEISILFLLFYLIISFYFTKSISGTLRTTWPFIFCVLIVFLITIYFRANATYQLEPYTIELSVVKGVNTWIKQIVSTVPFSYAFYNDLSSFRKIRSMFTLVDILFFFVFIVAFSYIYKRIERVDHRWLLFIISILLIVLPGALLTLSPKYQDEIQAGNGHIPVFFQYYGGALLAALCLAFLKLKLGSFRVWNIFVSVVAIALAMMFVVNLKLNIKSIEKLNTVWYYSRSVLEQSLQRGLFNDLPPESLVLYQDRFNASATRPDFYYLFTGRAYSTQDLFDFMDGYFNEKQLSNDDVFQLQIPDDTYLIDFHALNNSQGFVLLSKVKEISGTRSGYGVKVDRAKLFLINSNNWYNHLQNMLLENKPIPSDYHAIITIADAPLSSLKISDDLEWKKLPRRSKIEVTAPQTGNSNIITISGTGDQTFSITDIKLVEK